MQARTHIALVEDDAGFRAALASAVLQDPHYEFVGTAADLPQGLDLLRRQRPQLRLVDRGLPSGSGLRLIETLGAELPQAEAVVISSLGDGGSVLPALEAGTIGNLLKQGSAAELLSLLEALRQGGSPLSPTLARCLIQRLGRARPTPAREPGRRSRARGCRCCSSRRWATSTTRSPSAWACRRTVRAPM